MAGASDRHDGPTEAAGAHDVAWAKGGHARVVSASADAIVLVSTTPSPPGSRIEGLLVAEPRATIKVKIHLSRRQDDGTFRLEGRPLDLTRELRERVVGLAGLAGLAGLGRPPRD